MGKKQPSPPDRPVARRLLLGLGGVLLAGLPSLGGAQVPRFEESPHQLLSGLQSLNGATRRATILSVQRLARPGETVQQALTAALLRDPDLSVRQAAAVALAKTGARGRKALVQAGICDPDPSMRKGLLPFTRKASLRCQEQPELPDHNHLEQLPAAEDPLLAHLGHPSPATRLVAARELVRRRSPRVSTPLWNMISRDPAWSVRAAAVRMLARSLGERLLPALQHVLASDPDARVREVALEALAYLRSPKSVPWIGASARVEEVARLQTLAITILARIGNAAAATALLEIAATHKSEDARAAALTSVAGLTAHRARSRPEIARALKQDKSGKVRAAALRALSSDSSADACGARAERLRDPDPEVRRAIIEQLARCPAQIARPALSSVLREDREQTVRQAAAELLIKAGADKSLEALAAALASDKDPAIRKRCLNALAGLAVKERATPLGEAAKNDPDPELRRAAVIALQKLPAEAVVSTLSLVLTRDRVAEVRAETVRVLSRYSEATAYQALQKAAAQDPAPEVRQLAAAGAARSPAQRAWVESLLPQLINPAAAVRLKAVGQLCPLQIPGTYRALLMALWTDENAGVRGTVARCFADIDHPLVDIGLSVAHATDTDGSVVRAVELAQKLRVERLNKLLEQVRSSSVEERIAAASNLQPSPSRQVRDALELLLHKDPEVRVRRAAAEVLARFQDRRALEQLGAASKRERDPGLHKFLTTTHDRQRGHVATARAFLETSRLTTQLQSGSLAARIAAAQALGVLRDRQAWQPLREAARHTDPQLRHAAVLALGTFGDHAIISASARTETDQDVREALIQLNYLRTAGAEKITAALASSKPEEVRRGVEAAALKQTLQAVPWLVRVSLSSIEPTLREAAVRALTIYDQPLAHWAVRVAALHDGSKRTRQLMWRWAVHDDSGSN